ncbi:LemA family protein [Dehalogenimonas sp. 4OHTPN]|uniref:RING-type E3 ubiquitin transferase n=1 Tax=Dehalogenimonas sp. 4OHTPN TaxID=3166643 RepID=A0AAU8GAL4_9CHLR
MPVTASPFILLAAAALALGCLLGAFHFYRRRRLIDETPTSKTRGVFIGLAEVKGTAESETPLESYLAASRCVWYSYKVEEHWQRTTVNAKGHAQTQSGWKTVASETRYVPIFLKDDTGVIRVMPEGAEVHADKVFDKTCRRDDPLYYGKGPEKAVGGSTHRRRFTELALPLHDVIYVIGQARERQDAVAAEIAARKGSMFIISTHEEKHHSNRFRLYFWLWLGLGIIVAGGGVAIYLQQAGLTSYAPAVLSAAGIYLGAVAAAWVWTAYNSLVNLRQRVRQGFSQIDVELKRRADLIPNLVAVVEGFRRHESSLQHLAAELRSQAAAAGQVEESRGVSGALLAVAEKYPDLKADGQFLSLQRSLADTEERLALARDYYNSIATFFRTRLEVFPDALLGRLLGFQPLPLLQAETFERAAVAINLVD